MGIQTYKTNIPSILDLRNAIGREKKDKLAGRPTDTLHIRVRIFNDRWAVDSGYSPFIELKDKPEEGLAAVEYAAVDRLTQSAGLAKELVRKLRAQIASQPEKAELSVAQA